MGMRDERGMQMAISTIILIVLGILILMGLTFMLVGQFGLFKSKVISSDESNVDSFVSGCNLLAQSEQSYSYCCDIQTVYAGDRELEVSCSESIEFDWVGGRISRLDCSLIGC